MNELENTFDPCEALTVSRTASHADERHPSSQ